MDEAVLQSSVVDQQSEACRKKEKSFLLIAGSSHQSCSAYIP